MKTILENLKEYFDNTSEEQIAKDWKKTAKYDNVNSPTIEQFMLCSVSNSSQTANASKEEVKLGILHNVNGYWVSNEGTKENPNYHVWIPSVTHSVVDSAYDDLSLAVVRCNYLAKTALRDNLIAKIKRKLQ